MPLVPRPCRAVRSCCRGRSPVVVWLVAVLLAGGCGKKGPPLAPLLRVPSGVSGWKVTRREDAVVLTFVTPTANVAGDTPADVAAVEVYAVTARRPPDLIAGRVPEGMTLVGAVPVLKPLPPPPRGDDPPVPPIPRGPGVEQGTPATVTETLTAEALTPASGPPAVEPRAQEPSGPQVSLPLVFTSDAASRYYAAVAVSRSGRRSVWTPLARVPLAPPSGAPLDVTVTYDAAAWTVAWKPGPGSRVPDAAAEGVLESHPLGPAATPTQFAVYDATPSAAATRLTAAPVSGLTAPVPGVVFDRERCFGVRALDTVGGVDVEGPSSAPVCVTPHDTFAPEAPTGLEAVGGAGVISLIWDGVSAPDLAGYLVLRGESGGVPATLLTSEPIAASSFEDRSVVPGTRYVYVVVAVDSASPSNRSAPSNRAEETARQ